MYHYPILKRYLFRSILQPLLFCVVSFFALWLIYDLFDSLPDFVQAKAPAGLIFQFYLVQLPKIAQVVVPISLFFATLYVMAYFSKNQILVALGSAGQNLWQISWPFLSVAFALSLLLLTLNINLTPKAEESRKNLRQKMKGESEANGFKGVAYRNPATGTVWYLSEINAHTGEVKNVEILLVDLDGKDQSKLFASNANYDPTQKKWKLTNVYRILFSLSGDIHSTEMVDSWSETRLTETPRQLVQELTPPDQMSWKELHTSLSSGLSTSSSRLARYRTEYYERSSYPWICIVLSLFAIGLGAQPARRSITASIFNSITVLFAFLIWHNLSTAMGAGGRIHPWLAAWSSILCFGAVALYLFADKAGWLWVIQKRLKS